MALMGINRMDQKGEKIVSLNLRVYDFSRKYRVSSDQGKSAKSQGILLSEKHQEIQNFFRKK